MCQVRVVVSACAWRRQVWDWDRIGKDEHMCSLRLPIAKAVVADSPPAPSWHLLHLENLASTHTLSSAAAVQRPEILLGLQVTVAPVPCPS